MERRKFSLRAALVLALLGGAVHFASLRWTGFPGLPTRPETQLLDGPIVLSTYILLGAILYGTLLVWPVSQAIYAARKSFFTLLMGGLCGMIATIVALQGSYIAMGCVLMHLASTTDPAVRTVSIVTRFVLSMLDAETYGLFVMIGAAIPAFLCGTLITGAARAFHRQSLPHPEA